MVASTEIACVSPPHWRWRGVTEDGAKRAAGEGGQDAAVQLVDLEITLNGQDYIINGARPWLYFPRDTFVVDCNAAIAISAHLRRAGDKSIDPVGQPPRAVVAEAQLTTSVATGRINITILR